MEIYKTSLLVDDTLEVYNRFETTYFTDSGPKGAGRWSKTGTVSLATGMYGNGITANFDVNNRLTVNGTYNPRTGVFSFGCWFKKNGVPTWDYTPTFLEIGLTNPRASLYAGKNTGYLGFQTFDGSSSTFDSSTNICNNVWHHVVGIRDGTAMSLFVDGLSVATATLTARDINNTFVQIGNASADDYISTAFIDEAFVFSKALSTDEIGLLVGGDYTNYLNKYRRNRIPGLIYG